MSVLTQRRTNWWNAMQPAPPARACEPRPPVQTSFSSSGARGWSRPLMRTRVPHKTPPKRPREEEPRAWSSESLMRAHRRRGDRLRAEAQPEAPAPEVQPGDSFESDDGETDSQVLARRAKLAGARTPGPQELMATMRGMNFVDNGFSTEGGPGVPPDPAPPPCCCCLCCLSSMWHRR